MGFELASAFVTITADTAGFGRGLSAVKAELGSNLPRARSVAITADTAGVTAGVGKVAAALGSDLPAAARAAGSAVTTAMARARTEAVAAAAAVADVSRTQNAAGRFLPRGAVGVAPAAPATTALTADARGVVGGVAAARAALATLPPEKAVVLAANPGGFVAGIGAARAALVGFAASGTAGMAALGVSVTAALGPIVAVGVAFQGLMAAVGFLKAGVTGASDLNETVQKTEIVFGAATETVTAFAAEMAAAYGSSRRELLDAAASFGLMFKAAGLAQGEAAKVSVSLTKLADDASSFYNVPVAEALEKIRSGLMGEPEPMRRFGVLLDDSAMKAEAFRLGLARGKEELTSQQKVMIRASLIQKGMADATGDHARTAGSFANQIRELGGRLKALAVTVGSVVVPILSPFLSVLNAIVGALQSVAGLVAGVAQGIAGAFGTAAKAMTLAKGAADAMPKAGGAAAAAGGAAGTPAGTPTGAAPGTAMETGIEAARKAIATERGHADQKRLEDRVRDEQAMADEVTRINGKAAELYKEDWIKAEAARVRGRGNFGRHEDSMTQAARAYEAERKITGGELIHRKSVDTMEEYRQKVHAQETRGENFRQGLAGIPGALGGALGGLGQKAAGAGGALGEILKTYAQQARADQERKRQKDEEKQQFRPQTFSGGQDYRNSVQASILSQADRAEARQQREHARKTAEATAEQLKFLKENFSGLKNVLKGLGVGFA